MYNTPFKSFRITGQASNHSVTPRCFPESRLKSAAYPPETFQRYFPKQISVQKESATYAVAEKKIKIVRRSSQIGRKQLLLTVNLHNLKKKTNAQ